MWLFEMRVRTSDTYVASHLCGSSCVGPSWNALDKCSYKAHIGKSSSHLHTTRQWTYMLQMQPYQNGLMFNCVSIKNIK